MIANVVISFPEDRVVRTQKPKTTKANKKLVADQQKLHINRLIEENASLLATRLVMSGINIGTDDFERNYAFTVECLRSALYKSVGLRHPLQDPINDIIRTIESMSKD